MAVKVEPTAGRLAYLAGLGRDRLVLSARVAPELGGGIRVALRLGDGRLERLRFPPPSARALRRLLECFLADFRRGLPEHTGETLLLRLNMPHVAALNGPASPVEGLAGLACLNGLGVEVAHGGGPRSGLVIGVPVAFFLRDSLRALRIGA